MSTTVTRPHSVVEEPEAARRSTRALVFLAVGSLAALALALLVSDRTVGTGSMDGMSMTHYMGLLGIRQPWNLLLFMALPVVLAEVLAITELVLLFNPAAPRWVRTLGHWAGLLAGPVWVFILVHLVLHAVIPLTTSNGWRGAADVIAVLAYLVGAVPMFVISLLEAGLVGGTGRSRLRLHVTMVASFLVVAHVAMILGMIDPAVLGWHAATAHDMTNMPGMNMPGMNMPSAQPTR